MRFAHLYGASGPPVIIADDSLPRGAGSKFLLNGWPIIDQIVNKIAFLDASYQTNIPKANRNVGFQLLTEYEFQDEDACFLFTCTLDRTFPLQGTLVMGVCGGATVKYIGATVARVEPVVSNDFPSVKAMRLMWTLQTGAST